MLADDRTLETLDWPGVRERLVANTRTQRGRRLAEEIVPLAAFDRIRNEQAATAQVRDLVVGSDMSIVPAIDTAELTRRASMGNTLGAVELRALGDAIAASAAAYGKTRESVSAEASALDAITAPYCSLKDLERAIVEAIDERGTVLERASPALGRIRKSLQHAQGEARDRVAALLRSSKYAKAVQDAVVTIREGRFVVPVKAEFSGEVPGIVHDTSSSGQTVFIEPLAALDANNRVRTLRLEEEREIARILAGLSRQAGTQADQIEANVEMLAQLDVLVAKARLALSMDAHEPELIDMPELSIMSGRHPLLGGRAVPQSLALDARTRILIISGPNMGGKTVALKMVGLFVCMAYAGMQIPAAVGTRIGSFTRVFTDIGDEQSIAENTSTFSAHLRRMREIIICADERSLVLVDEIGGGTEPASGAALAVAILEWLLTISACGIVTTHATELKLFAHQTRGTANASVRFDPQTFAPTYHLDIGMPGQSLAFPLARSLEIPAKIIERAQALLDTRERDYESALAEISEIGSKLQSEREGVQRERTHVDRLEENLRSRTDALARERRQFADAAESRMQEVLREFSAQLAARASSRPSAKAKVTAGQSALLQETLDRIHHELGVTPESPDGGERGLFTPGEPVRVRSLGQDASVIADNGDSLLVAIGSMKTVVRKRDVERQAVGASGRSRESVRGELGGEAKLEAAGKSMAQLDVRGKRYTEAEPLVDRWIDEAVLAENSPLRLIHGKGTGMLGRGLQEFLQAHPQVKNVRYGDESEGGGGVTVFELR